MSTDDLRSILVAVEAPEDAHLIRRGAELCRGAGDVLHVVHVASALRGDAEAWSGVATATREAGGDFRQLRAAHVAGALAAAARHFGSTDLVAGLPSAPGAGVALQVASLYPRLEVHLVPSERRRRHLIPPGYASLLSQGRRAGAAVGALVGVPVLTWILSATSPGAVIVNALAYELLVAAVAALGGLWPALLGATLSAVALDYFFIDPLHRLTIDAATDAAAMTLFVANAMLVSAVVGVSSRRAAESRRAQAETRILRDVAGAVLGGGNATDALLERVRESFGQRTAALHVEGEAGEPRRVGEPEPPGEPTTRISVAPGAQVHLWGPALDDERLDLLHVVARELAAALEFERLQRRIAPLARENAVRSAQLSAVGHDLRRPLAAARTAVESLHSPDVEWSSADRDELLEAAQESLRALTRLLDELLDASRLQAGALDASLGRVDAGDVVLAALDELGLGPARVELDVPDMPPVRADSALLRRVLVNFLTNALRYSPAGARVRISTRTRGDEVEIAVSDRGPGVPPGRRASLFAPQPRSDESPTHEGLGLGLAISYGFAQGMGARVRAEDTPGGGLTVVVSVPVWRGQRAPADR